MEKDRVLEQADIIVRQAWGEHEHNPVEALRGEAQKRRVPVLSREVVHFERLLGEHIMVERDLLLGPTADEARHELSQLTGIHSAIRKRKIVEMHATRKIPRLESVVLSGNQISLIHDFIENYSSFDSGGEQEDYLKTQMNVFSDGLIAEYPTSPKVIEQSKVGRIFHKFTGQK